MEFESVDEILECDHLNNAHNLAVLSCNTVYYAVQGGSNFCVFWILKCNHSNNRN